MKNVFTILVSLLLLVSCGDDDNRKATLPPITTEGKNTFGCLINGEVFTPNGGIGGNRVASYQFLNGVQYFSVSGGGDKNDGRENVIIFSNGINLEEKIYEMYANSNSTIGGRHSIFDFHNNGNEFYDKNIVGELEILKFDEVNKIVSGTFWFDAEDENGNKVEIREGRFDMKYTI